jgi:acyl dehydratase
MALSEKDKGLIGRESAPIYAPDEVCRPMIRHWVEAVEDTNPLYTDEEYARSSKYGGIIAPPQMMMVWCMPRMWPWPEFPWVPMAELELPGDYDTYVATDMSFEFYLPVRPGDILSYTMKLDGVSEEKKTRIGKGHFITTTQIYRNQRGEVVGKEIRTVLKYKATK